MGRGRAPCCDKTKVRTGPWSPAEDLKLINFIRTHGHSNWRALPKQAGLLRCGKSCRLRWINYLRPDVKRGNFTPEEEETIIKLHNSIGNKWSKIASCLPGRTDNEIKNVWNTHLKKRLKSEVDCNRNNQGKDAKMDHSASSSCASSSITTCGDDNMEKLRGDNQVQEEKHEFMKLVSSTQSKENAILESPTSSCTSNFSNTLIQENRPKQALVHSKPCESTIPQLGSLENGITDIPTDFDVDFWQILDSLDPLQSNETTQNGDTTVSNIDEKIGDGEVEFGKWVRFLENELGLTSDGDNQQIVITANSEGMSYEPEINTAFFDYSPIWPSSPPYYLDI